jgi:hypothetical protein
MERSRKAAGRIEDTSLSDDMSSLGGQDTGTSDHPDSLYNRGEPQWRMTKTLLDSEGTGGEDYGKH